MVRLGLEVDMTIVTLLRKGAEARCRFAAAETAPWLA